MSDILSLIAREDAIALWRAAREAQQSFSHLQDISSDIHIQVVVKSDAVLKLLAQLLENDDQHVLEVPAFISEDGTVTTQVVSYTACMTFIYRRQATNEELNKAIQDR